jgi:hypothetical protein
MSGVYHEDIPVVVVASSDSAATGDKGSWVVPFKCQVVQSQVVWLGNSAHATGAVVAFDRRVLPTSDVGRVDGACGVIKKAASVNKQGIVTYWVPPNANARPVLEVGDEVVVEVVTANGAALLIAAQLIIRRIPETPANQPEMELTAP